MSERIYACLLRLFPSAFRERYQEESLCLLRDRLNEERGFLRRLRLNVDLIIDMIGALPQAYRNSYPDIAAASVSKQVTEISPFQPLPNEPIRRDVLFVASILTLAALAAFAYVIELPIPYPAARQDAPKSPIETVLERLNPTTSPDSLGGRYGRVYKVGGDVRPPIPLNFVNPEFPKPANNIKGPFPKIVIVRLIVDASGSPHNVRVLRSYRPDFDAQAVKAVEQDRFKPAELAGKPVAVTLDMVVNFWEGGRQPVGPPPPPPLHR